jgi:pSer/pThr/pTyr-binding forkhead associated (FHA) protein
MSDMNAAVTLSESSSSSSTNRETVPRSASQWGAEASRIVLVMTTGDQAPQVLDFGTSPMLTVGRAEPADVCVADGGVSRTHVRFTREAGGIRVVDLGSRNGTWVRGLRVTEALLMVGDCVCIGNTTLLIQAAHANGQPITAFAESGSSSVAFADSGDEFGPGVNLRASLREHESKLIREALRFAHGNQRRAAALLELPLRTFERKLRNMNLRQRELARTTM